MSTSRRTQTGLGIVMFLGLALASCVPSQRRTADGTGNDPGSQARASVEDGSLPRRQIIEAANTAARQQGWSPDDGEVSIFYDEGNVAWERYVAEGERLARLRGIIDRNADRSQCLAGHGFQVVRYDAPLRQRKENLWVLVDKETGDVLWVTYWP